MNSNRYKITSIVLLICMLLTLCSCSGGGSVFDVDKNMKTVNATDSSTALHITNMGSLKSVCKSGLAELFMDEANLAFVLKDTSGALWTSLPQTENKAASVISMDVTDGETTYKLNSQDNSVAFGTAEYETIDNGIKISYVLQEKEKDPEFKIPVTLYVSLEDGLLNVSTDCSKMKIDSDFKISKLNILDYFGAVTAPADGDFILIPDGSGALINLATAGDNDYTLDTYGTDYAVEEGNSHPSILGAFGLKNGANAYAAIVTEGDAISEINAVTQKGGIDRAFASFNITPNGYTKDGEKTEFALGNDQYEGKINVCYRFISGSSATYSGLAAMCREQLVRDGSLSTRSVSTETELPLNITLLGSVKKNFSSTSVYTTFENAEDIAGVLKAKGINALNIRYDGTLSGGINQKALNKASVLSKLGNKKDFESLSNYMETQGFALYMGVNLITTASSGSEAYGIIDNHVNISRPNLTKGYTTSTDYKFEGLASKNLTSNVVSLMNEMKKYNPTGYCINDAGSTLFTDVSGNVIDRQELATSLFGQTIALSTNKNLMVDTGNLYTLKNALLVSGIPMKPSYEENDSYSSVPFVQMILHGTMEYTGGYLNLAEDYNTQLLKSVEYGALPAFEWTYTNNIPKDTETSLLFYDNWTAKALEAYTTFNSVFADLRGAKMTGHTKLQDNLYRTEYNNETYIYVNYSAEDITYNNLTIKAGSYLRVN